MITADKLKTLTSFTTHGLAMALHHSGYTGVSFKTAKFKGITNGGQFAYAVTFDDGDGYGEQKSNVYLTYDSQLDKITAEY